MKALLISFVTLLVFVSLSFAQWNKQTVDNSGDAGKWSDIAYDSQGYPHIVYFDDTDNDLLYAKWNGTGWEIEHIASNMIDYGCAIAIDRQDHVHIVYSFTSYNYKYINYYNNISGSWEEIRFQGSRNGIYPDICLYYNQSTGQTISHISYYYDRDLYHAYFDPNTNKMISEAVDQASDVGINSHITCDDNGNLYISYYDQGAGALKFAYCDGSKWSTTTIDDTGDVGRYNSIALNNANKPCISYYDASNADLKYVVIENVGTKQQTVIF